MIHSQLSINLHIVRSPWASPVGVWVVLEDFLLLLGHLIPEENHHQRWVYEVANVNPGLMVYYKPWFMKIRGSTPPIVISSKTITGTLENCHDDPEAQKKGAKNHWIQQSPLFLVAVELRNYGGIHGNPLA